MPDDYSKEYAKQDKIIMRNVAMKMFLSVGAGFSMVLFSIIAIPVGIIYAISDSPGMLAYQPQGKWWILAGILSLLFGSFILYKVLYDESRLGYTKRYS